MYTAARTVKLGLKMSLGYGLLQDAISSLKGYPPRYIKFLYSGKNVPNTVNEGDKLA